MGESMENTKESSPYEYMYHDSHLSGTEMEAILCDFEFALLHLQEGFRRWANYLHNAISGESLPVADINVLQVLRMREYPKSVLDVAHVLNREDSANIAYSLRKLEKLGLAERPKDGHQSQTVYQITDMGRQVTNEYAELRKNILVPLVDSPAEFKGELREATMLMNEMVGLYDHAARRVAMLRPNEPKPKAKTKTKGKAKSRSSD